MNMIQVRASRRWRKRHPLRYAAQQLAHSQYQWLIRRERPEVINLVTRLVAACGFRKK